MQTINNPHLLGETIIDAIKLIREECSHYRTNGMIKCPKCGADLHWFVTTNGTHFSAVCDNDDLSFEV
jgi:carbonic anhydrase